jgi:ubinuclein
MNCQGKHSSDEEDLDDVPDDDQYDTEDSFIDDAELVSYSNFCSYF